MIFLLEEEERLSQMASETFGVTMMAHAAHTYRALLRAKEEWSRLEGSSLSTDVPRSIQLQLSAWGPESDEDWLATALVLADTFRGLERHVRFNIPGELFEALGRLRDALEVGGSF